jgi:phosphoglycerol transferase MdoB-like AlkP superfamily enzyme
MVAEPVSSPARSATTPGNLSFWSQPETKPRLAVWSPVMYTLFSAFFTPLLGSVLIAQNHRATEETVWRGISWFWLAVWSAFLVVGLSLHFAAIPCGPLVYWIVGFIALSIGWFFTCALPHRGFLQSRSFDAAWRTDWGKPVGFGFLAWVIVFTVFLLTR